MNAEKLDERMNEEKVFNDCFGRRVFLGDAVIVGINNKIGMTTPLSLGFISKMTDTGVKVTVDGQERNMIFKSETILSLDSLKEPGMIDGLKSKLGKAYEEFNANRIEAAKYHTKYFIFFETIEGELYTGQVKITYTDAASKEKLLKKFQESRPQPNSVKVLCKNIYGSYYMGNPTDKSKIERAENNSWFYYLNSKYLNVSVIDDNIVAETVRYVTDVTKDSAIINALKERLTELINRHDGVWGRRYHDIDEINWNDYSMIFALKDNEVDHFHLYIDDKYTSLSMGYATHDFIRFFSRLTGRGKHAWADNSTFNSHNIERSMETWREGRKFFTQLIESYRQNLSA